MPVARRRSWLLLVLVLALGAGGYSAWRAFGGAATAEIPPLHLVTRGALKVTVLEGGSLEALESTTISSQVEGQAAIIFLVEEGTILTPEDVAAGRVLVKLDSSELEERIAKQLIDLQAARAAAVNAVASLAIQQKEDASAERQAVLQVEFAELDLKRYVGAELAAGLVATRRAAGAGALSVRDLEQSVKELLDDPRLKGEALQTLRQLRTDISLSEEELKRALVKWEWSKKLLAEDFVSRDEEDADRLAVERRRIEKERGDTAYVQFATYDFPKQVTKLLSDLVEAEAELQRTRDRAAAAEQRAQAEVTAKREQEALQQQRYDKYVVQRESCVIKAPKAGLVLYASSTSGSRYGNDERIKEGTQVRERQPILTIPDTDQMGARINVHESVVDKVKPGQPVIVTVDALPDQPLDGTLESVKQLPNAQDRWSNPDLKVYATLIRLKGVLPGMRPGMSVKAEVRVAELEDVLQVPVQSVAGRMGRPTVWVWDGERASERDVRLGATNDRFVEVQQGLQGGERVLLAPPRGGGPEQRGAQGGESRPATAGGGAGSRSTGSRGAGSRGAGSGAAPGSGEKPAEGAGRSDRAPRRGGDGAPAPGGAAPQGPEPAPR